MADKFVVRDLKEYKEFLDETFSIKARIEKEEILFGNPFDAVDAFFEEFPEYYEDLDIELPKTFIEE